MLAWTGPSTRSGATGSPSPGLGEADRAFEQLEIAYSKREPWILALKVGPGFDTIRDDPRFVVDLLRRIGVEPQASPSFGYSKILRNTMESPAAVSHG